jgi:hypothetical protein
VAGRWRIAVTGLGLVTPLGLTTAENVASVLGGKTGIKVRSEAEGCIAVAVPPPFDITSFLRHPKNVKLLSRPVQMALKAVREALTECGLPESNVSSDRTGVYVASGQTGLEYDEFFKALTLAWEGGREQDYKYLGGMPTKFIDRYFSLRFPTPVSERFRRSSAPGVPAITTCKAKPPRRWPFITPASIWRTSAAMQPSSAPMKVYWYPPRLSRSGRWGC